MSVQVTCPPPAGQRLYLADRVTNADGRGHTEFYFPHPDWNPRTDASATQIYRASITRGVTRTWYLVSGSSARFATLSDQPGNVASDDGLFSIDGLTTASNTQVTRQIP